MSYEAILESAHRAGHDHHRNLLTARSAAELVTALALEFQLSAPEASASMPWPQLVAHFASAGACPKAIRAIQHSEPSLRHAHTVILWSSEHETCTCGKVRANSYALRVRHVAQLVAVCSKGERLLAGEAQNKLAIYEHATLIADKQGNIVAVGPDAELAAKYADAHFEVDLDCTGMSIVPGFVDAHTHPVWAGDRVHEFAMKLAGATYMDIHNAGGGIGFTVKHTREASEQQLLENFLQRARRMLAQGTTTLEAKSGYGLDTDTEMKMLRVLHKARELTPLDVAATYLGAHSVPKDTTAAAYTQEILTKQLPLLKKLREAHEISPEAIDIFFEKGVFEADDTRKILAAGAALGLHLNFHGDELHPMCAGELAGELGALAVSHLEEVSEAGIEAMAKRPSFAVLLPTTAYILRLKPPPARRFIEKGVPVALGSDFNPNAHCLSMPSVMHFACVLLRMTMPEALAAATINAAGALGRSGTCGSLEAGKLADFVLIGSPRWEHVIYEMTDPPIVQVFKRGKAVFSSHQQKR